MKHCIKYSIKRFLFFTISVLSAGLLSVSCVSTSSASGVDQTAASIATKDLANPPAKQEDEYTAEQELPLKEQASDQTDSADFAGLTTEAPSPAAETQDTAEEKDAVETREAAESQISEGSSAIEEPVIYDLPIDETKEFPSDTEVETILETPVPEELVEADFRERNAATPAMPKIISESTEAQNEIQAPDSAQTPTAAISQRETMRVQSVSESQDKEVKPSAAAQDSVSTADQASLEDLPSAPSAAPPIPSRSVSIKKNQYLDVEYPGSGWIYMGGAEKENKMTFFGKKISSENTVFILRSRFPGTTLLHFYKNDLLTGNYIDDYLEVIIESETAGSSQTHVKAPSYADIVPPEPDRTLLEEKQIPQNKETGNPTEADFAKAKPTGNSAEASFTQPQADQTRPQSALRSDSFKATTTTAQAAQMPLNAENSGSSAGRTVVQATGSDGRSYQVQEARDEKNSAPENMPAVSGRNQTVESENTAVIINQNQNAEASEANDMTSSDILKNAQEAYDKGLYEKSLSLLTDFFEKSQTDVDKALYLQGQNFEAESPIKNIKNAIDSYDTIVKNFRQSPLWQNARERSIYLKRFYIDIR